MSLFVDLASGLKSVVDRTRRLKPLLVRIAITNPSMAPTTAVKKAPATRTHKGGPALMIFVVKYSSSLKPDESSSASVVFSSSNLQRKKGGVSKLSRAAEAEAYRLSNVHR